MAGEIVHYEIAAKDPDRAVAFWGGLFGWQFGDSAMPEMDSHLPRAASLTRATSLAN